MQVVTGALNLILLQVDSGSQDCSSFEVWVRQFPVMSTTVFPVVGTQGTGLEMPACFYLDSSSVQGLCLQFFRSIL